MRMSCLPDCCGECPTERQACRQSHPWIRLSGCYLICLCHSLPIANFLSYISLHLPVLNTQGHHWLITVLVNSASAHPSGHLLQIVDVLHCSCALQGLVILGCNSIILSTIAVFPSRGWGCPSSLHSQLVTRLAALKYLPFTCTCCSTSALLFSRLFLNSFGYYEVEALVKPIA